MENIDVNPILKKFRKTNLYYTTDDVLLYQDPTYLGFKIFIKPGPNGLFSDCLDNEEGTAYSYLMRLGQYERAYYIKKFNEIFKKINNLTPWFFQELAGLEKAWLRGTHVDSYTPKISQDSTIDITCLESIDLRMTTLIDLYRKGCYDWEFRREIVPQNLREFECSIYVYESRIINREGTPKGYQLSGVNIEKFLNLSRNEKQEKENIKLLGTDPLSPKMKVGDKLKTLTTLGQNAVSGITDGIKGKVSNNKEVDTPDVNISRLLFSFKRCEILPDKSGDFLSSLKMSTSDAPIGQKLSFSYRDVTEENMNNIYIGNGVNNLIADSYQILDQLAFDNSEIITELNGESHSVLSGAFGTITKGLANAGADMASKFINTNVGKLLLGNVFGLSLVDGAKSVGQILSGDPNQALSGVVDLTKQGANLVSKVQNSINKNKPKSSDLGNIFK